MTGRQIGSAPGLGREKMAPLLKNLAVGTLLILGIPLLMLVVVDKVVGKATRQRVLLVLDKLVPPLLTVYWIIWFVRILRYWHRN